MQFVSRERRRLGVRARDIAHDQESPAVKVKHTVSGFNLAWKKDFTWLESVKVDGKTGMCCKLCANHGKSPRNRKGSWTINPCFSLRRDKVIKHESSAMHRGLL